MPALFRLAALASEESTPVLRRLLSESQAPLSTVPFELVLTLLDMQVVALTEDSVRVMDPDRLRAQIHSVMIAWLPGLDCGSRELATLGLSA